MGGNYDIIDCIHLELEVGWMYEYTPIFYLSSMISLYTLGLSNNRFWKSDIWIMI